ncbi:Ig-like domain-containing protein [Shimia abyssi]|uniref:Hemolysin type calcium-binding protein n=1 Tax=Shimia abyssi TaxID=1662395 RepID=A0A2P8F7B8_9RHOB|nr:tandem-95 repeat protein [Shimia abyssi]PSL17611.1 hemolysin type calcium-binding protein [Shimia abyssi]
MASFGPSYILQNVANYAGTSDRDYFHFIYEYGAPYYDVGSSIDGAGDIDGVTFSWRSVETLEENVILDLVAGYSTDGITYVTITDVENAEIYVFGGQLGQSFTINGTDGANSLRGSATSAEGKADFTINGLGGNDTIFGGPNTNILNGGAGDDTFFAGSIYGTETMFGGLDDDTYVFQSFSSTARSTVIELADQGTDTVETEISYTLGANVENLTLRSGYNEYGPDRVLDIDATGNSLANVIIGNSDENRIDGGGGNDTLTGGAGADQFLIGPRPGHIIITDFQFGVDRVSSSNAWGIGNLPTVVTSTDLDGNRIDTYLGSHPDKTGDITVTFLNELPVFTSTPPTTINEDEFFTYTFSATDPDGDVLTPRDISVPDWMQYVGTTDGPSQVNYSYSGTPTQANVGNASFSFGLFDGKGTATQSFTLDVLNVNDVPEPVDDSAVTFEDVDVTIDVLANDNDSDGDILAVDSFTQPDHGSVSENEAGLLVYLPDADYFGSDGFEYTVDDGEGGSATASVSLTIESVNDAPEPVDDSVVTPEDNAVAIDVMANDNDRDGDILAIDSFTQPDHGSVSENEAGLLVYLPDADYFGSDGFEYTVDDGEGGSATASVSLTIESVNDAPVALDDTLNTDEDTAATLNLIDNDIDIEGDPLTITDVAQGMSGSVTNNGDGTVTYTPNLDLNGLDSFTYTVSDGNGGVDVATVSVTINPVNDDPVVVDISRITGEDRPAIFALWTTGSDVEGDRLTVASVGETTNGNVTINGDGTATYLPDTDFNGSDGFDFTLSDGNGGSATARASVTVVATNDAPVALEDMASTFEDESVVIDVLANDSDAEDIQVALVSLGVPLYGTVEHDNNGNVTYEPSSDFFGIDSFLYTIEDSEGLSDTGLVTVTVEARNDDPEPVDDSAVTLEDSAVAIDPLANDSDRDGDSLTIESFTQPDHGIVSQTIEGLLVYLPAADYFGSDSFDYTVGDGEGGSATASVSLTIEAINDAPLALSDTLATDEDTAATLNPIDNDSDPEGDSISILSISSGGSGTTSLNQDGSVTYTPSENFVGDDVFTYLLSDGNGGISTGQVNVIVAPTPDDPIAVDDLAATEEALPVEIDVLFNDSDPDGDTVSILSVGDASNGTAELGETGVTYTPDAEFIGTDSFTYTVEDATGRSATATVTVTVGINDAPEAADDRVYTEEDTPILIDVLSNDLDRDNEFPTITNVSTPSMGSVSLVDGKIEYSPDAETSGTDSFSYTIADGEGEEDSAEVTVVVRAINDAPIAVNDAAVTQEDETVTIDVIDNDSDPEGHDLAILSVIAQGTGSAKINIDGNITYTPALNVNGTEELIYELIDSEGAISSATVSVEVEAVNDAPEGVVTLSGFSIEGLPIDAVTDALSDVDVLGDFTYQWRRNGEDIGEATGERYIPVAADINNFLSVLVSYTDGGGTAEEVISEASAIIAPGDVILGTEGDDELRGTSENDFLRGFGGNDSLLGSDGNDFLDGGPGNDFLRGDIGADTVEGGDGDDEVFAGPGDMGADLIRGGAGNDTIGGAQGNDTVYGGTGSDVVFGGPGDDVLDEQDTDASVNSLWAGPGADTVLGGAGNENLGGGTEGDLISAGGGNDILYGGKGTGADTLNGDAGNDILFGGGGNDVVNGGADDDLLFNGGGDDTVTGGSGSDELWGGGGGDLLTGGADADTFAFASGNGDDTISDFSFAEMDLLNVLGLGLTSEGEALGAMTDTANGALLSADGTTILLEGHTVADFTTNTGWFDETIL